MAAVFDEWTYRGVTSAIRTGYEKHIWGYPSSIWLLLLSCRTRDLEHVEYRHGHENGLCSGMMVRNSEENLTSDPNPLIPKCDDLSHSSNPSVPSSLTKFARNSAVRTRLLGFAEFPGATCTASFPLRPSRPRGSDRSPAHYTASATALLRHCPVLDSVSMSQKLTPAST